MSAARQAHVQPPASSSWAFIPPVPISRESGYLEGTAVALDPRAGEVYSIGGGDSLSVGIYANAYAYDPAGDQWSPIASLPQPRMYAAAAFLDGKMYVIGGYTSTFNVSSSVYAYDPADNSWSQATSLPAGIENAAAAVLDGRLYVIGGCRTASCGGTAGALSSVYEYDPAANSWTQRASYPVPVEQGACAGIDDEVVCAGGWTGQTSQIRRSAYAYNRVANTWFPVAHMPYADFGMGYAGANGRLQVFGGYVKGHGDSTRASQYDPVANTWSALPPMKEATAGGGSSCGLYMVGGDNAISGASPDSETLPGYQHCGPVSVPWLQAGKTSFTVPAGGSVTVPVTLDSSRVDQPGTYTAGLIVDADTPTPLQPVTVTLTVTPPKSWGEVSGTVTSAATGKPVAGATVVVGTSGGHGQLTYTTTTDSAGQYVWWLDERYDPLLVSAAAGGYYPQAAKASVTAGQATTVDFALQTDPNPNRTGAKR